MPLLKKTYHFFFFLGLFFLPFNSEIPYWLDFLGEYSADSSPLFFLIALVLLGISFIYGNKLAYPLQSTSSTLLLIFTGVILLCTALNIPDILGYYFKQTSGLTRFFRQLIAYILMVYAFFLLFYNVGKDLGVKAFFKKIRLVFLLSLLVVFACGFIEYLILVFHFDSLKPIYYLFDYLPFVDLSLDKHMARVASITHEPPVLGTYLITIMGFMFSYIFTEKKKLYRFIPLLMVLFLALVSKSRTAFVVIGFEFLVGCSLAYLKYAYFRRFMHKATLVVLGGMLIGFILFHKTVMNAITQRLNSLDFTEITYSKENNSISNKSRFGIQYAMFQTFKEHPVIGTGWGQQAFLSHKKYPDWATKNNYEFSTMYLNPAIKSFPPGYNLYLRILAETGLLGFLVFMAFLGIVFFKAITTYNRQHLTFYIGISIALAITLGGFTLNWLQIDSFRMYGFWLSLAILILLKNEHANKDNRSYSSL